MRVPLFISMLLLASAVRSSPGMAQAIYPYTFRIPVAATNLPAGSTINVGCTTYTGPNNAGAKSIFSEQMPAPNGAYSGVVTLTQNSSVALTSYACWVQVLLNNSVINTKGFGSYNEPPTPGWTGTMGVTGNL